MVGAPEGHGGGMVRLPRGQAAEGTRGARVGQLACPELEAWFPSSSPGWGWDALPGVTSREPGRGLQAA